MTRLCIRFLITMDGVCSVQKRYRIAKTDDSCERGVHSADGKRCKYGKERWL